MDFTNAQISELLLEVVNQKTAPICLHKRP